MKRFGDRRDGIKVRDKDAMHKLINHIKPNRCDSDVFINKKMDVTLLVKYMANKKRQEKDLTYYHLFLTVIAKTIGFTAKSDYSDESRDILSIVKVLPDDTLENVKASVIRSVKKVRNNEESGTNKVISILGKFPKFMISLIVKIVKFMDRHDMLPKSMIEDNLYYSSVIVSNLGSIHSGAIYHNLTDFGTSSILVTIGEIQLEKTIINNKEEERYMCEFGINIDERIADGVYFVKSINLMQDILNKPELLERRVSEKVEETTKYKY